MNDREKIELLFTVEEIESRRDSQAEKLKAFRVGCDLNSGSPVRSLIIGSLAQLGLLKSSSLHSFHLAASAPTELRRRRVDERPTTAPSSSNMNENKVYEPPNLCAPS